MRMIENLLLDFLTQQQLAALSTLGDIIFWAGFAVPLIVCYFAFSFVEKSREVNTLEANKYILLSLLGFLVLFSLGYDIAFGEAAWPYRSLLMGCLVYVTAQYFKDLLELLVVLGASFVLSTLLWGALSLFVSPNASLDIIMSNIAYLLYVIVYYYIFKLGFKVARHPKWRAKRREIMAAGSVIFWVLIITIDLAVGELSCFGAAFALALGVLFMGRLAWILDEKKRTDCDNCDGMGTHPAPYHKKIWWADGYETHYYQKSCDECEGEGWKYRIKWLFNFVFLRKNDEPTVHHHPKRKPKRSKPQHQKNRFSDVRQR